MKTWCICVAVLIGCAVPQRGEHPATPLHTEVRPQAIDLSDGVSEDEAAVLAERYYRGQYGESEGGARYAGDSGTHWLFQVVRGVAGSVEGTIYISKTNGVVSYEPK